MLYSMMPPIDQWLYEQVVLIQWGIACILVLATYALWGWMVWYFGREEYALGASATVAALFVIGLMPTIWFAVVMVGMPLAFIAVRLIWGERF